jgi:hypothetical protein
VEQQTWLRVGNGLLTEEYRRRYEMRIIVSQSVEHSHKAVKITSLRHVDGHVSSGASALCRLPKRLLGSKAPTIMQGEARIPWTIGIEPLPCHADPHDHGIVIPADGLQGIGMTATHERRVKQETSRLEARHNARELAGRFCIPSGEQAFRHSYLALQTQGVNGTADNRIDIDRVGGASQSRSGRSRSPKSSSPQLPKDAVGIHDPRHRPPALSKAREMAEQVDRRDVKGLSDRSKPVKRRQEIAAVIASRWAPYMHHRQQRMRRRIHSAEIWGPSFQSQRDSSLYSPQPRSEFLVDNPFSEDIGECLVCRVTSGIPGQFRQLVQCARLSLSGKP